MTDPQLKEFGVVQFGDRIAVRAFAAKESEKKSTKQLLERVRSKLEKKTEKPSDDNKSCQNWQALQGNKNAKKVKRRVEMGWLMREGEKIKQVRLKSGGGTRHLSFYSDDTIEVVKKKAADVFFPNGHSFYYGEIEQFNVSVTNFDTQKLDYNLTVNNLYSTSHVKILRLYLFTEAKFDEDSSVVSKECNNKRFKLNHDDSSKSDQPSTSMPKDSSKSEQPSTSTTKDSSYTDQPLTSMPKDNSKSEQPSSSTTKDSLKSDQPSSRATENSSESVSQPSTSTPKDDDFLPDPFQPFPDLMIFENIPKSLLNEEADEEIQFHVTDEEKQMQQSLLDNFSELNETLQNEFVVLKLHRGHVLNELEDFFMQNDFKMRHQTLQIKMILPNGETESAEDSGGVLRDCLSEYWNSFYTERTTGNKLKVPVLLHTVNGSRWQAVGKIIAIGYYFEKYYPSQLASCFLEYALNGDTIPENIILSQYLEFLPQSEKTIVTSALENFERTDQDDLMDFLEDHKVILRPTKENIRRIIIDTAHKELIQCPTYVADCWHEELKNLKLLLPKPFLEMGEFEPNFKNVWKTLTWSTEVPNKDIQLFMKKYLKEQSEEQLKKFLRFCTGKKTST